MTAHPDAMEHAKDQTLPDSIGVPLIWHAPIMVVGSLARINEAIRASWSAETCDPVDLDDWSEADPARGQCAVTALVVQDLLGGELLLAEVRHADGTRQGVHYWNRLCGGFELDMTREQFRDGEAVETADVVPRPKDVDRGRLAKQYRVLSERVTSRLVLSSTFDSRR